MISKIVDFLFFRLGITIPSFSNYDITKDLTSKGPQIPSEDELAAMTKQQMADYVAETFGIKLNLRLKKVDMVDQFFDELQKD